MKTRITALALAAALVGAALPAAAETLGERLDSGQLSPAAFVQLIADTGLTADEARSLTLNDILLLRTDSN